MHLLFEEARVLHIDLLDLCRKTVLLVFVVLLVTSPQHCLLVVVSLRRRLARLLLMHLLRQQSTHFILLLAFPCQACLVFGSQSQLTLHLIPSQSIILSSLLLCLLFDNIAGHVVHELLCTALAGNEFSLTILFLFVKHTDVLLLCLDIEGLLTLALLLLLLLVHLVFDEHLLEIVALLLALLLLQAAFSFHLALKSVNKLNFGAEVLFLFNAALAFLLSKLVVAAFLFLLSLDAGKITLFLLTHSQQLNVLLLQLEVDVFLFLVRALLLSLFSHLFVKLLAHETATLLLAEHSLLLFLVVKKLVELLDRCPLVFLSDFRVHFRHGGSLRRCN